jgi:hypothetical protein
MCGGRGDLKADQGLVTGLGHFVKVQEGIERWKDARQWLEIARFTIVDA